MTIDLEGDVRDLLADLRKQERATERLRISLEGENGKGGLVGSIQELSAQQSRVIANQEATSSLIRVGFWVMAMASALAIFISLTAIVISIAAFMKV